MSELVETSCVQALGKSDSFSLIRELSAEEVEEVSGGIAPIVGWGIALGLGFAVGFGGSYLVSS